MGKDQEPVCFFQRNVPITSLHTFRINEAWEGRFSEVVDDMLWKLPQLFSPVTKRHMEQQILYNTNIQKLFRIIQDVNQYSAFLPLCSYSKIIPASQRILPDDGRQYLEATLTVGLPPFLQETYDSAVYINHDQYTIETHSIKSQKFDSLKSYWKLSSSSLGENVVPPNFPNADGHSPWTHHSQPLPLSTRSSSSSSSSSSPPAAAAAAQTTTHVYFMVEMTVSDPVIATTLDQLLVQVAKQQVQAFAQRCQTIE